MRAIVTIACALQAVTGPALAACNMPRTATHADPDRTVIRASANGVPAIYYRANMDVNTDGSSRSYHPDDPRGSRLAFNNIGNAISRIFDASGQDITCSPRRGDCFTRFIITFESARDSGYAPNRPRVETAGMIPWRTDTSTGRRVPCTIAEGLFKGYFVSQTSLSVDPSKDSCDQGRYLDSLAFNAVVLPRAVNWSSQGTRTDDGDLVVVRDVGSGRIAFAINGDRGPAKGIGEGTIRLAAALKGATIRGDEPYDVIKRLALRDVQYVTFPKNDIRREVGNTFTQGDIDKAGAELFERWGGKARLDACLTP